MGFFQGMGTADWFLLLMWTWIGIAGLVFVINLKIVAPYGRHTKSTWGPMLPNRLGWFLMETPVLLIAPLLFFMGDAPKTTASYVILACYVAHYSHRALIFPWRLRTKGKKMPLAIMFSAVFFNFVNAGALGYYLGFLGSHWEADFWTDPRFVLGALVFLTGAVINLRADTILLNLRKPGETGYKIPKGFLFDFISCPNHFGEIVEWAGFALMSWSLPGLAFALWTAANLIPRALAHHRWYQEKFEAYPVRRKAVFPGLF